MSLPDESAAASEGNGRRSDSIDDNKLISGVVEGFYGKPWSLQQRKHLFAQLRLLGMNTYFYAPKDDAKHRGDWRLLYSPEEIEILHDLINSANENEIDFVYALSPGIDIQYSVQRDIDAIKEKFSQVKMLGCKSFALLFDDIETEMQENDKQSFSSFASAQVSVSNEVFKFLDFPKRFYFCPTEYCETRAQPTLRESEYLNTIGQKLLGPIQIMWTGSQVIAKTLSPDHASEVAEVLRRKPIIWDNLHANDYDPRRLFMGPFAGRSVKLKEQIAGLLLNPNCKYEANFVPLRTLSDWFQAESDAFRVDDEFEFETENNSNDMAIDSFDSSAYHPQRSLRDAILKWTAEFDRYVPHFFPGFPCTEIIENGSETEVTTTSNLSEIVQSAVSEQLDTTTTNVNSLLPVQPVEMMDVALPQSGKEDDNSIETNPAIDEPMESFEISESIMGAEYLNLLVDIFFLPFDSGNRANEILEQFCWLYENAHCVKNSDDISMSEMESGRREEWLSRERLLKEYIKNIKHIFRTISVCPNKLLVAELIPYIWEVHGVCAVLNAVVEWLKLGAVKEIPDEQQRFWSTETDEEPWLGNGGFLNNIFKALAGGSDLYSFCLFKCLLPLSIVDFTISPLTIETVNRLSVLASVETERTPEQNDLNRSLFIDKYVRIFTDHDPNYVFVTEDDGNADNKTVVSSAIAVLNAAPLVEKLPKYIEELKDKYSNIRVDGVNLPAIVCEIDKWFPKIPKFVTDAFPSWIDVRFSADAYDAVPTRRMILAVSIALSMNGSKGVLTTVPVAESEKVQFFIRIGFVELSHSEDYNFVILGRSISRTPADELIESDTNELTS